MKESYFLFLLIVLLLCLLNILVDGINVGFDFPKLLRILPDGFELGVGFGMLLFQSCILCIQLMAVKLAVREFCGQFATGFIELFQLSGVFRFVFFLGMGELDFCKPSYTGFISR